MIKPVIRRNIPNTFTLVSFFLGFSSILACLQALQELILHAKDIEVEPNPEKYLTYAALFIFFGTIFDVMDGFMARLLNASSEIGKQLDSLSDLVSFGVAPGVLFYTVTLFAGERIPDSGIVYTVANLIPDPLYENLFIIKLLSFLFPICAVIRLAKFNQAEPSDYFEGIPSTYAGLMMAIIFTFNFYITPAAKIIERLGIELNTTFMAVVNTGDMIFKNFLFLVLSYIALSILMVSTIRFYKVHYFFFSMKKSLRIPVTILIGLALLLYFKYTILIFGVFYFSYSIMMHFYFRIHPEKVNYSKR